MGINEKKDAILSKSTVEREREKRKYSKGRA